MKTISFVIACYNCANSIEGVVQEIIHTMHTRAEYAFEIILVNDSSRDESQSVISQLCARFPFIKGIHLARNFGQQPAMLAGFAHVTGETVVYCDDDGQSPVKDLFLLLEELDTGIDMVWAKYPEQHQSILRRLGSSFNNLMVSILLRKPLQLVFGNFWVARRFIIDEVIKCQNPYPYLGGLFLSITANMSNVQLEQRKRVHGQSNYSLVRLVSVWLNGLTGFSVLPLRAATFLGVIIFCFSIIYIAALIYTALTNPNVPVGYSSVMCAILFVGGLIMIILGLIGEYIGRIYININRVSQYVIKEKVNC